MNGPKVKTGRFEGQNWTVSSKIGLWLLEIRVVGKNGKLESFKLESLKLESFAEVGNTQVKLERTERSWKEPTEVGKFRCSWKVLAKVGKNERT